MKRIVSLLVISVFFAAPALRAQDAATEERFNKLQGVIDDIRDRQEALNKNVEALRKELQSLRAQVNKPTGDYASQQDLKELEKAVREIDRKRLDDYDKIGAQLRSLGKTLAAQPPPPKRAVAPEPTENPSREKNAPEEKGFEHTVRSGETLSLIVQAYRDQNIKVTMDQVRKANPGIKPEKLKVGQKIWIPAPQQ